MNRLFVRNCFVALLILLIPTGLCEFVYAAQLRLAWDANTESNLAGYKLHYGTASRSYGVPIIVGNVTTYTLTGLTGGQTYYLALTAYDTANNESNQSNEVSGVAAEPTQTVAITVTSNPIGREIFIDGSSYSASQAFSWVVGSSHALSVNSSPQNGSAGTRYAYSSWSDGSTQTHTITVPSSSTTYTANFTTQYSLSTSVSPGGSGSVNPGGANWHNSGQNIPLSATASTGYTFSNWSGSMTHSMNPTSITMDAPKSVTANFTQNQSPGLLTVTPGSGGSASGTQGGPFSPSIFTYTLQNTGGTALNWNASATQNWISLSLSSGTLSPGASTAVTVSINQNANGLQTGTYSDTLVFSNTTNHNGDATRLINLTVNGLTLTYRIATSPSGLGVKVDGVILKTPKKTKWPVGSTHSLAADSPQNGTNGKRYIFSSWSDGGNQTHPVTASSSTTSYTANFSTQYSLTTSVNMTEAGTVTPLGTDWHDKDQVVTLSAQPNFDYSLTSWTNKAGDIISKSNPLTVSMTTPKNLRANFKRNTYALVTQISPKLAGSITKSPKKSKYFYGDQVTLIAKANPGYAFSGWSGDASGTQSTITITVDANKSIGVNFSGSAPRPQVLGTAMETSDDLPLIGELESPSGGKNMSGVKAIYGWALDKEGIAKIELFVDGSYVCQIPYGGLREDLREAHPRYPKADQSGFALIWNYSVLTPGEHTVEVVITNNEDQTLDLATTVNVVKFHGDGITQVTPEILSSYPVSVTADGLTKTYDVNIQWFDETQDFGITEIIPRE